MKSFGSRNRTLLQTFYGSLCSHRCAGVFYRPVQTEEHASYCERHCRAQFTSRIPFTRLKDRRWYSGRSLLLLCGLSDQPGVHAWSTWKKECLAERTLRFKSTIWMFCFDGTLCALNQAQLFDACDSLGVSISNQRSTGCQEDAPAQVAQISKPPC